MSRYTINGQETHFFSFEVEAESREEAEDIAHGIFREGDRGKMEADPDYKYVSCGMEELHLDAEELEEEK